MPRRATGQLCENRSKLTGEVTSWGARFRYEGRRWYVTERDGACAGPHVSPRQVQGP
jgi:hypothetical protein